MEKIKEMCVIALLPVTWLIYVLFGTCSGTDESFGEWWGIV
jgi:hypothetical protein